MSEKQPIVKSYRDLIFQGLSIIVPTAIVIILVAVSFLSFLNEASVSIHERNKTYIKDFTRDLAVKLDDKFNTSINSVAAIAKMNAEKLITEENIADVLSDIETETQFDHVRFVDMKGISHTSSGTTADVSDRIYFADGIKGNMGSTYITNSRLTNQRQIGFYAPMTLNGKIQGVIVAFCDEKSLLNSIDYEFYGEKASVGIISTEGKMIINSPADDFEHLYAQGIGEDICDLLNTEYIDSDDSTKIEEAYKNLTETDFEISFEEGTESIGYMAPVQAINLSVYMIFPNNADTAMYENDIASGKKLESRLIFIFLGLVIYLLALGAVKLLEWKRVQRKLLKTSNTDEITGVLNRRAYEDDLKLIRNIPDNFIFATFDINGLKNANDTLGHSAGDELIIGAAKCLTECFGEYGKVYRVGGDEFVSIFYADENTLSEIREKFERTQEDWKGRQVKRLFISSGYVRAAEIENPNMPEISNMADERMYEEKKAFYRRTGMDRRRAR